MVSERTLETGGRYHVVGPAYVSLYYKDFDDDPGVIRGWHLGSTWLTLFPSQGGTRPDANPCNTEFAVQAATSAEVDVLLQVLVDAGATSGWAAEDTEMYDPMRFGYVEDPFGVRIDVYCPL